MTGVTTHGGNVVSDTDSTDDLGTTSVRWANLFVDAITATDQITATGFTGTLDGILGSGAAAAAAVTTLDTSGVVNLNLTTDSSSSTSGALIVDGGVGIAKKLFVGTDADIDGTLEADAITLNGTALGDIYSPKAGSSSIVTTGALNSGSITSGFGAVDNGASAITTTGAVSGGTITGSTSVKTPLIEYTDGDDAITIADGGGTTFAQTAAIPAITGLTSINSGQIGGSRNKVMNGAMVIDQRNAGASVTPTNGLYTLDRWQGLLAQASKYTVIQSATAPTGFIESLLVTSSSAYSLADGDYFDITQYVEGLNMADLAWGTASAATVTLSFYVRSSLTGTFGGSLQNNGQARSYPFSYAISSADTWEKKSITIAGDTSGTWLTTNGRGIQLNFSLGTGATFSGSAGSWAGANYLGTTSTVSVVSTNAATWYVTGVQLEKGSTATEFEHRSFGEELALCQRYFTKSFPYGTAPANNAGVTNTIIGESQAASGPAYAHVYFKQTMRAAPSISHFNPSANNGSWRNTTANSDINVAVGSIGDATMFIGSNTQVMNQYAICQIHYSASAEL